MTGKTLAVVLLLVLVAAIMLSPGTGCDVITRTGAGPQPDLSLVNEVWDIIHEDYVEPERLDADTLTRGAVRGMVDALDDPYSSYLEPEAYEASVSDLEGKFEGIGAYVGYRDGRIVIIAPIPDSPADRAGIRPGDVILGVDGETTMDMSLMDAVFRIRGPRGTSVILLVLHEGDTDPVDIEIIRAEIELESVLLEMKGDIAHVTVTNFTERTSSELATALQDMERQDAGGIVLDLRGNPGGMLTAVIEVASRFLEEGVVLFVVDNEGNREETSVRRMGPVVELPMVVLVNGFSASGSEVLAGALQDHDRAVVAGETTFGKGSVNVLHRLSDGSGVYLTVARWYTPDGRVIEGEGIEPDFPLDPEQEDLLEWALAYLRGDG